MHHALEIQEILLNIFGHCHFPSWDSAASDLPALARTCRGFKEPALDVLWEELVEASPIALCFPEASHHSQISSLGDEVRRFQVFITLCLMIEWGILRSYTRRIRSILDESDALDWESVGTFLNPPANEPLFPNLRHLCASQSTEIKIRHMLYMPFPSLTSLDVWTINKENLDSLQGSLESFSMLSPNIRSLSIYFCEQPHIDIMFSNLVSSYICRWRDLQSVDCGLVALDVDALAHLSRLPALTRLSCTPSATSPPSDSPIFFTNLHHLTLYSKFLGPISQLSTRVRLPAITHFTSFIYHHPSKQCFSSFLASVRTSVIGHTIQELKLKEEEGYDPLQEAAEAVDVMSILGFGDLQLFMAFSNLRRIYISLGWKVDLSDRELLTLASAWPHLEHLLINAEWGWNTPGGITPNGLLQLLGTCSSLSDIALVIDTRGYIEFPESPASLGLTMPPTFSIDVLDSTLAAESIPAIAAFLAGIAFHSALSFSASNGWFMDETDEMGRWYDAYNRSYDFLGY
ncbi:hypothetical protein OG21DRAFT_1514611 [Imleria badia]|nr:hypothetical protein OG21DRAFT_1514611 [Imleria badia]